MVAEFWARWLGIQLNDEKRELALSTTRHLGFAIDLKLKMVKITDKHRRKIFSYFDRFLLCVRKNERLLIKNIQKMLGLQIWISTVFSVARQFLTSICDMLKAAHGRRTYIYPRKHSVLVARVIRDLKFWRRLVSGAAKMSFSYLLNRLPVSNMRLSCDASATFGMAGVLHFQQPYEKYKGCDGLC